MQTDEDHPMAVVGSTSAFRAATLRGSVWDDRDSDGVRDPGEPGLGGVRVQVEARSDRTSPARVSATTAADGSYAVPGPAAGDYAVSFPTLPGRRPTRSAGGVRTVALDAGATRDGIDQGYRRDGRPLRPPHDR